MILKKIYTKKKRSKNISKTLQKVDYIILSPGINIQNINNKKKLLKYKKIITDLDLIFLLKKILKLLLLLVRMENQQRVN